MALFSCFQILSDLAPNLFTGMAPNLFTGMAVCHQSPAALNGGLKSQNFWMDGKKSQNFFEMVQKKAMIY